MPSGSEKHLEASARIIKLALAFYRKQPIQLPDAEHVESMLNLLRLANGDAELMAWATQLTGADENELHLACIAFIEHAFFTVATDHFGVLGLNPWANAADVKEHYRLLMRLFHPDRGLVNSARADKYAAMINQAYAALKQEMPVAAEIENHKSAVQLKYQSQSASMRGRMIRAALAERVDASFSTWLTPAKLLLTFALLATLVVWMFFEPYKKPKTYNYDVLDEITADAAIVNHHGVNYLNNQLDDKSNATIALDNGSTGSGSAGDRLLDDGTDAFDAPKVLAATETAKADLEVKPAADEIRQPVQSKLPLGQPNILPQAKVIAPIKVLAPPKVKPQSMVAAQPGVVAQPKSRDNSNVLPSSKALKKDADAVAVNSSAKPVVDPLAAPSANVNSGNLNTSNANVANIARSDNLAETMPTTRELRELMIQFNDGYERGDIEAFMQVFADELASDEAGGRAGFKQAYSALFDTTTSRVMMIQNLHWSKKEKLTIGEADYRIKTKASNKSEIYDSHGTFRFEVVKANNKVKITGFYYVVAND